MALWPFKYAQWPILFYSLIAFVHPSEQIMVHLCNETILWDQSRLDEMFWPVCSFHDPFLSVIPGANSLTIGARGGETTTRKRRNRSRKRPLRSPRTSRSSTLTTLGAGEIQIWAGKRPPRRLRRQSPWPRRTTVGRTMLGSRSMTKSRGVSEKSDGFVYFCWKKKKKVISRAHFIEESIWKLWNIYYFTGECPRILKTHFVRKSKCKADVFSSVFVTLNKLLNVFHSDVSIFAQEIYH